MQDVPKIVLRRLPEMADAGVHPDADLLTAFAERSLGESERSRVMEHMARCGDCREVVAIALPASESAVIVPLKGGAGRSWLSGPVLRWGLVVGSILLVASVGILQYGHRQEQYSASVSPLSMRERAAAASAQNSAPASPDSEGRTVVPQNEPFRSSNGASAEKPPVSSDGVSPSPARGTSSAVASAGSGGIMGGVFKSNSGTRQDAAAARESSLFAPAAGSAISGPSAKQNAMVGVQVQDALRASSPAVEVRPENPVVAQNQISGQLVNQPNLSLQGRSVADFNVAKADVVKAKDAASVPGSSGQAPRPTTTLAVRAAAAPTANPSLRWAISSNGALQRSFDGGQTWQDVTVTSASLDYGMRMPSDRGMKMPSVAESKSEYAERGNKKQATQPVSLVFRAVAATGGEVWAGGSGAVLYHSTDSGDNWVQVMPSEGGFVLTGDVIDVEFSEPQSGRIVTSAGEVWTTTDAGRSWHKQQ